MRIEMLLVPTAFAQHFYSCFYLMLCISTTVDKFSFSRQSAGFGFCFRTQHRIEKVNKKTCKMKVVTMYYVQTENSIFSRSIASFLFHLLQKNPLGW